MAAYNEEFKSSVVRKLLPPNELPIAEVSRQVGVSEPTLLSWKRQLGDRALAAASEAPTDGSRGREFWVSAVQESEGLRGQELSAYCRRKGVYLEQIEEWRAELAGDGGGGAVRGETERTRLRQQVREQERELGALRRELARKDKALAEAVTLLVLGPPAGRRGPGG